MPILSKFALPIAGCLRSITRTRGAIALPGIGLSMPTILPRAKTWDKQKFSKSVDTPSFQNSDRTMNLHTYFAKRGATIKGFIKLQRS
jgi:hypothetical protein